MENRPVIILGGGLWGGLLAYRLSEMLPGLNFRLYERDSTLGGNQTWLFHEKEIGPQSLKWMRPLIDKTWDGYRVQFPDDKRLLTGQYHSISSRKFHDVITSCVQPRNLKLNNEIPIELAIREASFVIDTRNTCLVRKSAYQKCLGIEVELEMNHGLEHPIFIDASIEQKDGCRYMSYFPIDERTILIRDTRYSKNKNMNCSEMRIDIGKDVQNRGWKFKKIIREESKVLPIPLSTPFVREESRVINLGDIFHDSTGYALADAAKLIDLMINSSFRFGELRKIILNFRNKKENQRKFFRLWNRLLFSNENPSVGYKIFQKMYQLPESIIQKYHRGDLDFWDKSRIVLARGGLF